MGRYQFLAPIIVTITVEWLVFVAALLYWNKKHCSGLLFEGKSFETITSCPHPSIPPGVLAGVRLVLFGWFCGFSFIYNFVRSPHGWHYYTNWNLILISIYYMLVTVASALKLYKDYKSDISVSAAEEALAKAAGTLYPVVGSAAIMITILNFILLSSDPDLWNITQHATTSISFIIFEMPLNDIPVNWPVWAVSWPVVYLFFIWPVVAAGAKDWPYYFLEVENAGCFFWYQILFLASIMFFCFYYGIVRTKESLLTRSRQVVTGGRNDEEARKQLPLVDIA